jgi:hypothetical protein
LIHTLLQITTLDNLLAHPVAGFSWEGMVIEQLLSVLPKNADFGFYRTSAGAELDLVLQLGSQLWAVEIRRTLNPKLSKGFLIAAKDVKATHRFFVYAGKEQFPMGENTLAIGVSELMIKLREGF